MIMYHTFWVKPHRKPRDDVCGTAAALDEAGAYERNPVERVRSWKTTTNGKKKVKRWQRFPRLRLYTRELARFYGSSNLRADAGEGARSPGDPVWMRLDACCTAHPFPGQGCSSTCSRKREGTPELESSGRSARTSISQAALINGTAGHAFRLDDMHRLSLFHPGSITVPVALALRRR